MKKVVIFKKIRERNIFAKFRRVHQRKAEDAGNIGTRFRRLLELLSEGTDWNESWLFAEDLTIRCGTVDSFK